MVFLIMLGGIFLGLITFMFTFIVSKRNGKYYLAPIVTFLFSIVVTAYGFIVIRGFEGMAYGFLAAGFLIVSIVGTLLLPLLVRRKEPQEFKKFDKIILAILPIIFIATIGLVIYSDQGYWIIDKGETTYTEDAGRGESYYRTSTISEGKKQVTLRLGEKYLGKEIVVESVSKWRPTEITVKIVEGENKDKTPYIMIGLDEIREPLKVQSTDGMVFESMDKVSN
ncbi:hypothetical protein [Gracilibacillus saliphilus]|uniref:hypothetical protein n=1 Tax=Gracilibacillus saliphilus TaxID=543890 RepID=UPI0013D34673|nr:hypothetical protein [Gracilibacillus saliphilus]